MHTGWSASNSEPYIRTRLAQLSKSEIFFGNQGTLYISEKRRKYIIVHHRKKDSVCVQHFSNGFPTFLVQTGIIRRLHIHHVHMLLKQLDDFVQLLVVAVAVHKYVKLRVASFGFSGLYVYKVDMVLLKKKNENI